MMRDRITRSIIDGSFFQLTERQQRVLTFRFGLFGHPGWGLEETGRVLGITRERVRQIEASALAKHPEWKGEPQ